MTIRTGLLAIFVAFLSFSSALQLAAEITTEPKRPEVGKKVKDFDLPIVGEDKTIKLSKAYEDGPVVVVVLRGYPGYQCPICSRQVAGLANRAKVLDQAAERVILVYPGMESQLERHASEFVGSRTLPDPLVMVRDPGMEMVESWGLRWDAPRETAYPSTFVIDKTGKVAWSKISEGHGDRSNVSDILAALRKLK